MGYVRTQELKSVRIQGVSTDGVCRELGEDLRGRVGSYRTKEAYKILSDPRRKVLGGGEEIDNMARLKMLLEGTQFVGGSTSIYMLRQDGMILLIHDVDEARQMDGLCLFILKLSQGFPG